MRTVPETFQAYSMRGILLVNEEVEELYKELAKLRDQIRRRNLLAKDLRADTKIIYKKLDLMKRAVWSLGGNPEQIIRLNP